MWRRLTVPISAYAPGLLSTRGVTLVQGGGDLRPGNGGYRSSLRHIGPILLQPVRDDERRVRVIGAGDWRRLVGVRSDWLEVVRP